MRKRKREKERERETEKEEMKETEKKRKSVIKWGKKRAIEKDRLLVKKNERDHCVQIYNLQALYGLTIHFA